MSGARALGGSKARPAAAPSIRATEGDVKIQVTDMAGRCVATVANEYKEDLDNETIWDQSTLSPGIYYLTLEAADHRDTKMISITE